MFDTHVFAVIVTAYSVRGENRNIELAKQNKLTTRIHMKTFDEFMAEMALRDANEHPFHRWLRNRGVFSFLYDLKRYGPWHMFVVNVIDPIRYFFQRRTRGWSDDHLWSLDVSLAKLIYPRLKEFKKNPHKGCPGGWIPYEKQDDKEFCDAQFARWQEYLDKMLFSFEHLASDEQWAHDISIEEEIEHDKRVQEGLELFGQYFRALWS